MSCRRQYLEVQELGIDLPTRHPEPGRPGFGFFISTSSHLAPHPEPVGLR